MKSSTLPINGLRCHLNTWGDPKLPTIFFIHGWMDCGASFSFVADKLKKDFYCVALDLRGFGRSEHKKNLGYFFYEYVADVQALFDQLSPEKPVTVVGHSMGGNIISLYAGAFPERVKNFINVEGFGISDMDPEIGPDRMRQWLTEKPSPFRVYPHLQDVADRLMKANPRLAGEKALFLAEQMSQRVNEGYQIAADPQHKLKNPYLFQLANIIPFWKKIQARCLQVIGAETEMMRWMPTEGNLMEEIDRRLKYFPNSSTIVIPGCGHMIHHEKPEELAQAIRDFIGPASPGLNP